MYLTLDIELCNSVYEIVTCLSNICQLGQKQIIKVFLQHIFKQSVTTWFIIVVLRSSNTTTFQTQPLVHVNS